MNWTPWGHVAPAHTRNDFKMCGCILRKNRPWHNIRYQTPVIDTETGCALHWVIMNLLQWPQSLHFWAIHYSSLDALSTTSGEMNYEWGTNDVFHHLFTFSDQLPSFNLPERHFFWSYCQLEWPLVWSGYKVTHTWGNLAFRAAYWFWY